MIHHFELLACHLKWHRFWGKKKKKRASLEGVVTREIKITGIIQLSVFLSPHVRENVQIQRHKKSKAQLLHRECIAGLSLSRQVMEANNAQIRLVFATPPSFCVLRLRDQKGPFICSANAISCSAEQPLWAARLISHH